MTVFRAVRTPLLAVGSGLVFLLIGKTWIPNLVITLHDWLPGRFGFYLWVVRADYFFYAPNQFVMWTYLAGAFILLEIRRTAFPRNQNMLHDGVTALLGLVYALSMLLWMKNLKPGTWQILLSGGQVALLWLFVVGNARLAVVERWLAKSGVSRLLDWTFPISDVAFYMWHRERIGETTLFRWLPSVCYLLGIMLVLGAQLQTLLGAIRAERVDVPIEDTQYGMVVEGGFWFTNGNWFDAQTGIWFFDDRTKTARPVIRVADSRQFYFKDGFFYIHDRYDGYVRKVNATTRKVVWEVPVERAGTYQVVGRDGLIFAAGEGGYILVVTEDGHVVGRRLFYPLGTWLPQAVWGGQVAFISGDERVHFWNSDLTAGESISLPLPQGVRRFVWNEMAGRLRTVTNWTDYVPQTETLYIQTHWGEIFRYDVKHRRWLDSIKAKSGLRVIAADGPNRLVFAWNYFGGLIEVIDEDSGRRVGMILAGSLGRYINLDPAQMIGIANSHGYGVWRFDYSELVRRRNAQKGLANEGARRATPSRSS